MADFASSLPVRTENAGDLQIQIVDGTLTSNKLKVESDGSINTNTTFSATNLDIRDLVFATDKVDASGSSVELGATTLAALENISATVTATDLDIRNLAFATDTVDASGSTVELGSTTLAALENISATVTATDLDIRNLAFATDTVDVSGSSVTVSGSVTVTATDLDIRNLAHTQDSIKLGDGTDFLAINADGSLNVKITDASPDTAAHDYDTDAAVAAGATGTHTYTSTGNFYLEQVEASASGKLKIVVKVNAVTKFVGFSSTANPNISFVLKQPILATTGQTVTVERTNMDNQAQDVYSTIIGYTN